MVVNINTATKSLVLKGSTLKHSFTESKLLKSALAPVPWEEVMHLDLKLFISAANLSRADQEAQVLP